MGIKTLREKNAQLKAVSSVKNSIKKIFFDGLVVNTFNPKTALFFLAFIPQFIRVDLGNITFQTVLLGLTFVLLALISDGLYVILSGQLKTWIKANHQLQSHVNRISGVIFICLGLITLKSGKPHSGVFH